MGRRDPENINLQSRTLRRNISCVKVEEKRGNLRKSKSEIRKAKHVKLCDMSSEFKNPAVVLERIDSSHSSPLHKQRSVLGDKTNFSPKSFSGELGYIDAHVSLKHRSMDTQFKSQVRQSPRGSPSGDLRFVTRPCSVVLQPCNVPYIGVSCTDIFRKHNTRKSGSVLNETLANNSLVNIPDAMQKPDLPVKSKLHSSKSQIHGGNVNPVEKYQNIDEDLIPTLTACEPSEEKSEEGTKVLDSLDSPSLRRRSSRRSHKESSLCEKESSCSNTPSVHQKNFNSSDKTESHTCVYSKVPRDTLKNNCMPVEEKLALYEFEVDENEPVVKSKQKRKVYVKHKKRNLCGDPAFHSTAIIAKNSLYNTRAKKVLEPTQGNHNINVPKVSNNSSIKNVQGPKIHVKNQERVSIGNLEKKINNMHNNEEKHVHFDDVPEIKKNNTESITTPEVEKSSLLPCRNTSSATRVSRSGKVFNEVENITMCDTPKSGGSRTSGLIRRRVLNENVENCPPESPIARPGCGRTPLRKLKNLEEFSEFQDNFSENGSRVNCDLSMCKIQSNELLNATNIGTFISSPRISEKNYLINKTNESELCSKPTIASHSTPEKCHAVKANETVTNKEEFWSPIPTAQSPCYGSVDKGDKTGSTVNSSLNKSLSHQSIPLSRKVFFLPRVSGGGTNIIPDDRPDKKWDVGNCFGFDDENEEAEMVPFYKIPSANKLLSKRPFSSTPMNQRPVKPLPTRLNVKRKIETTSEEGPCKSPRLEDKKTEKILKSLSKSTCDVTAFSNPLKQTKLDFTHGNVTHTNHKVDHSESTTSPKLFNSDDDKTPTHFTQPPRRSYNRLVRKNLQFVGDEWIEVDEDEGESQIDEEKPRNKRTKKSKLRKLEEKEASKWIEEFNSKCEEIQDFELCVE